MKARTKRGFEAFREAGAVSPAAVYAGGSEPVRVALRLVAKRDATTRIRGLAELLALLPALGDAGELRDVLPHWAFLFARLQKHNDRRVRLHAARVMAVLLDRIPVAVGEKFVPGTNVVLIHAQTLTRLSRRRLHLFAPDWLCSQFDPDAETAAVAASALSKTPLVSSSSAAGIPTGTLDKLFAFIRQRSPDETIEEEAGEVTPEEIADRSHRVRAQALRCVAYLVQTFADLDLAQLNEASSWHKFLVASDAEGGALVRRAAYELLAQLAVRARLAEVCTKDVLKYIHRLPGEKERSATPGMWSALVSVGKAYPEFWDNNAVDALRKAFFPELFRHFDRAANGAGFSALSSCVVLLSLVPAHVWSAYGYVTFANEWLNRLWSRGNGPDSVPSLCAALECCAYVQSPRVAFSLSDSGQLDGVCDFIRLEKLPEAVQFIQENSTSMAEPLRENVLVALAQAMPNADVAQRIVGREEHVLCSLFTCKRIDSARVARDLLASAVHVIESHLNTINPSLTFDVACTLVQSRPEVFQTGGYAARWSSMLRDVGGDSQPPGFWERARGCEFAAMLVALDPPSSAPIILESMARFTASRNTSHPSRESCVQLQKLFFSEVHTHLAGFNTQPVVVPVATEVVCHGGEESLWDGANEALVARWLDDAGKTQRVERASKRAREIFAADAVAFAELQRHDPETCESVLDSLHAYDESMWPQDVADIVFVLRSWFARARPSLLLSSSAAPRNTERVVGWLATHSHGLDSREEYAKWAALAARVGAPLPELPSPDAAAVLWADHGVNVCEAILGRHFASGSQPHEAIVWWIARNAHSMDLTGISAEAFFPLVRYAIPRLRSEGDCTAFEACVVDRASRAIRHDNPLQLLQLCADECLMPTAPDLARSFALPMLLRFVASKDVVADRVRDMTLRALNEVIALVDANIIKREQQQQQQQQPDEGDDDGSEEDGVVGVGEEEEEKQQQKQEFRVGDRVWYAKTTSEDEGRKVEATVVARHDDDDAAGGTYYTIRWWGDDQAKETQTFAQRLFPRGDDAEERANLAKNADALSLADVQRMLAQARARGDKQESMRLMKLQEELAPKPKDTYAERAKVEAKRAQLDQVWRERRRVRQLRGNAAINYSGDGERTMEEMEARDRQFVENLQPDTLWEDERVVTALRFLSGFSWRTAGNSELLLPLSRAEKDKAHELVSVAFDALSVPPVGLLSVVSRVYMLVVFVGSEKGGSGSNNNNNEFLNQLLRLGATQRNVDSIELLGRMTKNRNFVVAEAIAGRILGQFLVNTQDEYGVACAGVIPHLRLPARLVWDAVDALFALQANELTNSPARFACFYVLYRYPKVVVVEAAATLATSSSPSPSPSPSEEEARSTPPRMGEGEENIMRLGLTPAPLVRETERVFLNNNNSGDHHHHPYPFLLWLLLLRYTRAALKADERIRESLGLWLRRHGLVFRALEHIASALDFNHESNSVADLPAGGGGEEEEEMMTESEVEVAHILRIQQEDGDVVLLASRLASRCYFHMVHVLPALVREWWSDHRQTNRMEKENLSLFTAQFVTPQVLQRDMRELNDAAERWDKSELLVRTSLLKKTVTICSFRDDASLEMEISFPDAYPLFPAEVQCTKQMGIKPEKWKRWALQIVQLLGKRDGTLSEAVTLWKDNLDKEFAGLEPCPICYSVVHVVDASLPKVTCRTCKNVYHGKCLIKWFSSGKSNLCPMCRQPFPQFARYKEREEDLWEA